MQAQTFNIEALPKDVKALYQKAVEKPQAELAKLQPERDKLQKALHDNLAAQAKTDLKKEELKLRAAIKKLQPVIAKANNRAGDAIRATTLKDQDQVKAVLEALANG